MSRKRICTDNTDHGVKSPKIYKRVTLSQMKIDYFPAIIIMQRIGKIFQFSDDTMKRLHRRCYENPSIAHRMFIQFKKYLEEMERRTSQRIPKEQLIEYFGGNHKEDVVIKGTELDQRVFFI